MPSIIESQVSEQLQKLEDKLLRDFKALGQKAIEESATALNRQLDGRIQTLEQISAMQAQTIGKLRDSSKIAEQKVGAVVNAIERTLAGAVPGGFELPPPQPVHPQFDVRPRTELVRRAPVEIETRSIFGFCPQCTSTNVRRASRSGLFEEFLRLFFIAPFRCRSCRHKFYRF